MHEYLLSKGTIRENLTGQLFPVVGMGDPMTIVANFGEEDFVRTGGNLGLEITVKHIEFLHSLYPVT